LTYNNYSSAVKTGTVTKQVVVSLEMLSAGTMDHDSPKRNTIVTSESEAPQDAKLLINKSNTLKIRLNPMDFDYFDSVVRSDDEREQDTLVWKDVSSL